MASRAMTLCVSEALGNRQSADRSEQLFLSDPEVKYAKSIGWTLGDRIARWAMVIDHGKITYAEKEPGPGEVTVGATLRCLIVEMLIGK